VPGSLRGGLVRPSPMHDLAALGEAFCGKVAVRRTFSEKSHHPHRRIEEGRSSEVQAVARTRRLRKASGHSPYSQRQGTGLRSHASCVGVGILASMQVADPIASRRWVATPIR
jgi:hypothetical protein